jgi:hypothetical protein
MPSTPCANRSSFATHAPPDLDDVDGVTGGIAIVANKSSARVAGSDFASVNAQAAGQATAAQSPPVIPRERGGDGPAKTASAGRTSATRANWRLLGRGCRLLGWKLEDCPRDRGQRDHARVA